MIGPCNPHVLAYTTPKHAAKDRVDNIYFIPADPPMVCSKHKASRSECTYASPFRKYTNPFHDATYADILRREVMGRWDIAEGKMHLVTPERQYVNTLTDEYLRRLGIALENYARASRQAPSPQEAEELARLLAQPRAVFSDEQILAMVDDRVEYQERLGRHALSCNLCQERGYVSECGFVCPVLEEAGEEEETEPAAAAHTAHPDCTTGIHTRRWT